MTTFFLFAILCSGDCGETDQHVFSLTFAEEQLSSLSLSYRRRTEKRMLLCMEYHPCFPTGVPCMCMQSI